MIARAHDRLGDVMVHSDAMRMSIGTDSVDHALSVWVVHSVADPVRHSRSLRELDEASIEEVTRPVVDALRAMPQEVGLRRGTVEAIVFRRGAARR
jgi:hypothetical protein